MSPFLRWPNLRRRRQRPRYRWGFHRLPVATRPAPAMRASRAILPNRHHRLPSRPRWICRPPTPRRLPAHKQSPTLRRRIGSFLPAPLNVSVEPATWTAARRSHRRPMSLRPRHRQALPNPFLPRAGDRSARRRDAVALSPDRTPVGIDPARATPPTRAQGTRLLRHQASGRRRAR